MWFEEDGSDSPYIPSSFSGPSLRDPLETGPFLTSKSRPRKRVRGRGREGQGKRRGSGEEERVRGRGEGQGKRRGSGEEDKRVRGRGEGRGKRRRGLGEEEERVREEGYIKGVISLDSEKALHGPGRNLTTTLCPTKMEVSMLASNGTLEPS